MDNSGTKNLGNASITVAVTASVITEGISLNNVEQSFVSDLQGALAASFLFDFSYGSGGTSVKAYLQTTLDQGNSWIDVACVTFTTSSARKAINLSGLTPKTTAISPSNGALADDTCVDGFLGPNWRVIITSLGTYVNTNLSVRGTFR